jgi:hypothetical protein
MSAWVVRYVFSESASAITAARAKIYWYPTQTAVTGSTMTTDDFYLGFTNIREALLNKDQTKVTSFA